MSNDIRTLSRLAGAGIAALAAAVIALGVGLPGTPARAEETKKDDKKVSSWVKLCDAMELKKGEKKKEVCIVHHERLDPNNGMLIIAAAVRTIEGSEHESFMVTVPLGVALPPGIRVTFDEESKDPLTLKFSHCLPNGCTAEAEATDALIAKMAKAKVLNVATISAGASEQVVFQVPLNGFKSTMDGEAVDAAKFQNARKQLLLSIRERMIERAKQTQAAKKKDGAAEGEQSQSSQQ